MSQEPRVESQESRVKSPLSPLLSRKKEKFSEKREIEPRKRSRVHKSFEESFFDTLFSEERTVAFSAKFYCVSFFMSGGRLLNRNISDDI